MIDPHPIVLEGHGVRLEPIDRSHAPALSAAAADGELWKLWYVSTAGLAPGLEDAYVDAALSAQTRGDQVVWVVRELTSGLIIGSTRFHDIVRSIDRVEIGYTFYASRWHRTHVNTACKRLLLGHAFETLGCAVVGFRVDQLNERSQNAVLALGARRDGILRHFQARADGSARDVHLFSILADEWPDIRRRLEARLARHSTPFRGTARGSTVR